MTKGVALPPGSRSDHRAEDRTALTRRQAEVLRLMAQGKTQDQIASELSVHVQTVKNHRTGAYQRLGVSSMTEAYIALGWLRLP